MRDAATGSEAILSKELEMVMRKNSEYTIRYYQDTIVLSGAVEAIHSEAERILRRFAYSAKPYEVKSDAPDRIILATAA